LTELVLSVAVMTVLTGGIASAMLLAARAVPDRQSALSAVANGYSTVDILASELATARSFSIRDNWQVLFTVADRNGDGTLETIRYIWAGTPGTPLKRSYNAGGLLDVAEDVHEFELTYDTRAVEQTSPPAANESAETWLIGHKPSSGYVDHAITPSNSFAECFWPNLPSGVTSWKLTRVKLKARVHGDNKGITRVQARLAGTGGVPSTAVLDDLELLEVTLSDEYTWREFSFGSVSGMTPSQGICIVLQRVSDQESCDVQGAGPGAATGAHSMAQGSGSSWSATTESLAFEAFGTVTSSTAPEMAELFYLTGARIKLRVGDDPATGVETGVRVFNEPEVAGP
jgi:hypothetical protein